MLIVPVEMTFIKIQPLAAHKAKFRIIEITEELLRTDNVQRIVIYIYISLLLTLDGNLFLSRQPTKDNTSSVSLLSIPFMSLLCV